ncbi:GrpB family protein [Hyphomonas sp.]|jgi:GrpB-like predicted nucleotidyltransferase (UPF0157 family)|uniref:GrpB family protein n=1 Tax=Hyphomonas sp. TaxID=87 RepID=UPI0025BA3C86|nr:GrpB family protein [Hyphomonas sp.]
MSRVTVVPHDPAWARAFAAEAAAIKAALGGLTMTLHHIGSTAVPGILAKPVIDLLGEVEVMAALDAAAGKLVALGYEALGANGISGRRYFRKLGPDGERTHHLHVFTRGSPQLVRHLAFRDYLRAMPDVARAYSELKAQLTRDPDAPRDAYIDGKAPFVLETEKAALDWYCQLRG